jgi:bifunctional non-homologous end joining protein LigD
MRTFRWSHGDGRSYRGGRGRRLRNRALRERSEEDTTFFVFDLLHLDGHDLRKLPLAERKSILELVLAMHQDPELRYSPHFASEGPAFVDAACKLEVASVVAKRLDRPYRSGRARDWLRIECDGKRSKTSNGRRARANAARALR